MFPLVCCPRDAWTVHGNPTLPTRRTGPRVRFLFDHPTLLRGVDVPAVACRKSQSAAGPTVVARGSRPGRCHWCEVRFEPSQTRASRVDVGQDGVLVQPEAWVSWDAVPDVLAHGGSVHPGIGNLPQTPADLKQLLDESDTARFGVGRHAIGKYKIKANGADGGDMVL